MDDSAKMSEAYGLYRLVCFFSDRNDAKSWGLIHSTVLRDMDKDRDKGLGKGQGQGQESDSENNSDRDFAREMDRDRD